MEPYFSVIVPNYNGAKYLKSCLDSVLSQSFDNFDVIVVDNYSDDESLSILNQYESLDSRIKYYQEKNYGIIAHSRNFGIQKARGQWICTIDSDDIWYPEKLKCIYDVIQNNTSIEVISHNVIMKNMINNHETPMVSRPLEDNIYKELLIHRNLFVQSSMSYKHDFLTRFNLLFDESRDYVTVEDYDFSMQLARAGAVFFRVEQYLGEWRVYNSNNSSSPKHIENFNKLVKQHVFEIQTFDSDRNRLWNLIRAGALINEANRLLKKHKILTGVNMYVKALFISPMQFKIYIKDRLSLFYIRLTYNQGKK